MIHNNPWWTPNSNAVPYARTKFNFLVAFFQYRITPKKSDWFQYLQKSHTRDFYCTRIRINGTSTVYDNNWREIFSLETNQSTTHTS